METMWKVPNMSWSLSYMLKEDVRIRATVLGSEFYKQSDVYEMSKKPALDGLRSEQQRRQEDIEEVVFHRQNGRSTHVSSVLADPTPMSNPRIGVPSTLLPYTPQSSQFSTGKYVSVPRKKTGKLDDVLASGWLAAMLSSSPPRKKLIKDLKTGTGLEDFDIAYSSWMLDHPSALKSFDKIINLVKDKKIAMFLDYDGTLSPIVDDPNLAIMPEGMHTVVEAIAKHFPTAVISGRNRDKVYELVGLTDLYYAGSHGMDILGPASETTLNDHPYCTLATDDKGVEFKLFQPAKEFIDVIDKVFRTLVENTKGIKGAKVENHKFCASVHYRNVDEKNWTDVAQCVHDVLSNYPRLRLTHGRKVLEVHPAIDWNKGKAVEFLLESLGKEFFPIYIGDDRTDEDAFKVLQERNLGFGILVSSIPKETKAFYSLNDPYEVQEFLQSLVRWKEEEDEVKSKD